MEEMIKFTKSSLQTLIFHLNLQVALSLNIIFGYNVLY